MLGRFCCCVSLLIGQNVICSYGYVITMVVAVLERSFESASCSILSTFGNLEDAFVSSRLFFSWSFAVAVKSSAQSCLRVLSKYLAA